VVRRDDILGRWAATPLERASPCSARYISVIGFNDMPFIDRCAALTTVLFLIYSLAPEARSFCSSASTGASPWKILYSRRNSSSAVPLPDGPSSQSVPPALPGP